MLPGRVRPASIHIDNGTIVRVEDGAASAAEPTVDFGDLVVSPGVVDTHVHVNEPGRTEWEGFDTATRAAAAGGVTTIVDMPLNSIPATTTPAALAAKRSAARGRVHVDVGFWGGVVPGNAAELDALVDAGVRGFKCFLVPSGVDEFREVGDAELREAMPILARRGAPLLVHAEHPRVIADCARRIADYDGWLASRPPQAEVEAIRLVARLAREFGARVHIVHVASAEAADAVAAAKADGVRLTAETCPHYLTFSAAEVPPGATEFKCAPPIRERKHRDALWTALERGTLDLIATDHSPAPPSMKCPGDFGCAWGGIASLELSLAATWTGASRLRQSFGGSPEPPAPPFVASQSERLVHLARWMSEAPAALAGLSKKGRIEEGNDADLVVWDPDEQWTVDAARLRQRHKLTPYHGRTLDGRVRSTYVRGVEVWADDGLVHERTGRLL